MKRQYITLLLLVGLVSFWAAPSAWARRPNVILIMADDLGHESLRSYGGTSYNSQLLDDVGKRGMRFTQCYSQPICTPSRNQIMTGRSNARNYRAFGLLIPEEITFGSVMKDTGYKTCIAGKWQLSGGPPGTPTYDKGVMPIDCGFDQSCMWAYSHDLPPGVKHTGGWEGKRKTSRYWHPSILENGRYRPTTVDDYGPDIYTQFILDFMETNKNEEFFVYYPMALTHAPFYPTPHSKDLATADKFKNDKKYFGDMIEYTGFCVTRIFDQLDKLGLADNTLVLFTTDNGSNRGVVSHQGPRIVPGGKGLPIDAGCHAPLLAVWKGKITPGTTCNDLVEFSDFMPTIAAVSGAKLPTDRPLDGWSFLPQLEGKPGNPRAAIFMHYDKDPDAKRPGFERIRFAFDGHHKLYLDGTMFDVSHDIEEERPLDNAALSSEAQAARGRLQRVLDAMPPWEPDNSVFKNGKERPTDSRLQELRELRAKASRQAAK
jgi:arylsulfatase A-like enzyme